MVAEICDREHRGKPLLAYEAACAMLAREVQPLTRPAEAIPLREALGRLLAVSLGLDRDEPPLPRSAMDGFAVRSADGMAQRQIVATIHAGTEAVAELAAGKAMAVMTGGTVPPGADCVIPIERTRREGDFLILLDPQQNLRHVRRVAEIGARGRMVLESGSRLRPGELAIAASVGADPIFVRPSVRAAVLSTGDEVVPWASTPLPHQVRDGNRLGVCARLLELGAEVVHDAHLPDDFQALERGIQAALECSDLVITIGGVSMGEKDLLPAVFAQLGVRTLLHGVALQPGKPLWVGSRGSQWILGLPGNPLSAFTVTELFARPMLRLLEGAQESMPLEALFPGVAGMPMQSGGRDLWLPAQLVAQMHGAPRLHAAPWNGSGDWSTLAGARALWFLPAGARAEAGDAVRYLPLD